MTNLQMSWIVSNMWFISSTTTSILTNKVDFPVYVMFIIGISIFIVGYIGSEKK